MCAHMHPRQQTPQHEHAKLKCAFPKSNPSTPPCPRSYPITHPLTLTHSLANSFIHSPTLTHSRTLVHSGSGTVRVSVPGSDHPGGMTPRSIQRVRYAFADWPVATLFNTAGQPALPFDLGADE